MTIKTATMGEYVERYFDCPYCGRLNSDEGGEGSDIESGALVKCQFCGKTARLTG